MKIPKKGTLLALAVCAAAAAFAWVEWKGEKRAEFATSVVQTGDIRQVVEATGTINAVTTVLVGSQVSGVISELFVDFNSQVKKGQVIAQIEPALFQGAVAQAQADVENAEANLALAAANVTKAKVSALQMRLDFERNVGLKRQGATSEQLFESAKASADGADAQVEAAIAQERQARAQVAQKKAALQVTQTNFDYTTIRAPINGIVVARNVDVGQTVAASLQAPTLFTIAQDLTKMQVYAKTDESDVGGMQHGQSVSFKVDAYPRETFRGAISQVRMNSTVVQNVVTYDTIIEFENPDLKLFPGMTAYVTIPVAEASNVLRIPNAALRYKPDLPPAELQALFQKYGVPDGDGASRSTGAAKGVPAKAGAVPAGPAVGDTSGPRRDVFVVWLLTPEKTPKPVRVSTGITDHTSTALVPEFSDGLKDGDLLITGVAQGRSDNKGGPAAPRR